MLFPSLNFLSSVLFLLLYFKFWGTRAECAGVSHRYTWQGGLLPPSLSPIWGIYPHVIPPQLPTSYCPSPSPPQQTPVCDAPLPVSMCSHCSTPAYE